MVAQCTGQVWLCIRRSYTTHTNTYPESSETEEKTESTLETTDWSETEENNKVTVETQLEEQAVLEETELEDTDLEDEEEE